MKKNRIRVGCPKCNRRVELRANGTIPIHPPKGNPSGANCEFSNTLFESSYIQTEEENDGSISINKPNQNTSNSKKVTRNKRHLLVRSIPLGIILSLISISLAIYFASESRKGRKQIETLQRENELEINQVPESTVERMAELIGMDAAIREEGPLKDLASLAKEEDIKKKAAKEKINSGNPKLEIEGANELHLIANKRASVIKSLSVEAAEDYRQAGSAYLVAQNIEKAILAYKEASRLNPDYYQGHVTLSELALEVGDMELALSAAKDAVSVVERESPSDWNKRFALMQLGKVQLARGDLSNLAGIVNILENQTNKKYYNALEERKSYNDLMEIGLKRTSKTRENEKYTYISIFYDGNIAASYEISTTDSTKFFIAAEALTADAMVIIYRFQLIEALQLKGEMFRQDGCFEDAALTYEKSISLSKQQFEETQIPGLDSYLADYLENLGEIRNEQGNLAEALNLFRQSTPLRRSIIAILNDSLSIRGFENREDKNSYELQQLRKLANNLEAVGYLQFQVEENQDINNNICEAIDLRQEIFEHTSEPRDRVNLVNSKLLMMLILGESNISGEILIIIDEVIELCSIYPSLGEEYNSSRKELESIYKLFNDTSQGD